MKLKTTHLAAVLLAAFGASNIAMAEGFYIQTDFGLANVSAKNGEKVKLRNARKDLKKSYKDSKFMQRASVGYDFGNVRVAADYTHYTTLKDNVSEGDEKLSAQVKTRGLGVSAIYDFDLGSNFEPYVGARLSTNRIKTNVNYSIDGESVASVSKRKSSFGYGVLAGVGYKVSSRVTADVGYRYNSLSSDVKSHEVSAGVRVSF